MRARSYPVSFGPWWVRLLFLSYRTGEARMLTDIRKRVDRVTARAGEARCTTRASIATEIATVLSLGQQVSELECPAS